MRFALDENVPRSLVAALRARGHDVLWASEAMPAAPDAALLARAQAERRIIVTFDKDFGDLAYRTLAPARCGVVLFRERPRSPRITVARVIEVVKMRADWTGWFASADAGRVRLRLLPHRPRA